MKLEIIGGYGNYDYLEFKAVSHPDGLNDVLVGNVMQGTFDVYTLLGTKIGKIEIREGENPNQILRDFVGQSGTYALRNNAGTSQLFIVK